MRRFWLEPHALQADGQVHLTEAVLHHVRDVCRLAAGDHLEVLVGDGQAREVELLSVGRHAAVGRVVASRAVPPLPRPHLHLALALCRPAVFDAVLERAVELGVAAVQPFFSAHSFERRASEGLRGRAERWQRIVRAATQQCGRGESMAVAAPVPLAQALGGVARGHGVFAFEGAGGQSLADALAGLRAARPPVVTVFVGGEGGFAADEVAQFAAAGLPPVTLGTTVLRVETACIALLGVVRFGLWQNTDSAS